MAMLESAETQIAGLWGLSSPMGSTAGSTPEAPQAPKANEAKTKPAKFRRQEKGGGKGQIAGRKRQEPPEEEEAGERILVSQSEIRTIRTLLVRHDQALNQLAVDRTYVLFFSTTDMSTLAMLRTVTNHWREQYTQGSCTTTLRAALLTSLWLEMEARLTNFEQDAAAIKVMVEKGLFLEAPSRWAYTAWNQQEKKAQVTDQPHLSSDELKAAIKTLKAAAMTGGHPQVCPDAEAGGKHHSSGSGLHAGADDKSQGREGPHGNDEARQLGSDVSDWPTPATGKAAAQSSGESSSRTEVVGSSGAPHCQMSKDLFDGDLEKQVWEI